MPSQSSLTAELSSLNSCSPLTTHTAIAGILSQMILWPFIIFNFYSPAIFTKSHSVYFRKESKTTVIFSPANQILSQNQKYNLSIIITGSLIPNMTKYKTLFFLSSKIRPQVDANKTNIVYSILVPVLCVLRSNKPTITMRKVQLEVSPTSCISSSIYLFYQSIRSA